MANVQIPLGGVTFEYKFEKSYISTNPGNGRIGLSGDIRSSGSDLFLSELDQNGTSLTSFLSTISTVSSAVVGHFRLFKKTDASKFVLYQIEGSQNRNQFFEFKKILKPPIYSLNAIIESFLPAPSSIIILSALNGG